MKPPAFGFGRVSLARATRHADALARRYLSLLEREEIAALHVPKRRTERIAGRLAAHRALHHAGVLPTHLSIVSVAEG
jgi:4'-phosphopantetheinyl transferase EntD